MAAVAWATVAVGTFIVDLVPGANPGQPRSLLLADPSTEDWHKCRLRHLHTSRMRRGRDHGRMPSS